MLKLWKAALMGCLCLLAQAPTSAGVEVNTASEAQLQSIKGIGPSIARRVLQERQDGAFRNWFDLIDRVPGVGPKTADRFSQAGLRVDGACYSASSRAMKPAGRSNHAPATPYETEFSRGRRGPYKGQRVAPGARTTSPSKTAALPQRAN